MKKLYINKKYIIYFLITLVIEICIALFVHDKIVRPYIGDVLVVVLIYLFIKIFLKESNKLLPVYIFIFSGLVEILQYFNIVELLGLSNNRFLSTLIGTTFDVKDILCYLIGCIILYICQNCARKS